MLFLYKKSELGTARLTGMFLAAYLVTLSFIFSFSHPAPVFPGPSEKAKVCWCFF